MRPPKCKPYPPSTRYRDKVVRSLHYNGESLTLDIQGRDFTFARVVFQAPAGFRVLAERGLCEFWNTYSEPNGWLYEVEEGGWLELEGYRSTFNSPEMWDDLKEWLVVDDMCVSVLSVQPPQIVDLGADPEQLTTNV